MDSSLFGSRLRLARERRRLTLKDLATRTKLSASLFESLEDGTCRGWPVGVYSRAHVRTYAELIGLDGGEVVEEFSTLFPHLAWSEQDQAREVVAALRPSALAPAPRGLVVAPLRLVLDEEPLPFWRALLTRIAWVLHRLANGGAPSAVPVIAGGSLDDEDPDGEPALVPFTGFQVD
jgi:transcriptional regulator with XRE-family HTH domain